MNNPQFISRLARQISQLDDRLRTLYRRSMMSVTMGKVTAMADDGAVQSLQYQTPVEVRGDTPRLTEFGFSSGPPAGSDVLVACLGGDRACAIVIASNHSATRHGGLSPGETVIFNQWGQYIKLTETGIEVQANGKAVDVKQATQVTVEASAGVKLVTPLLQVTGDIQDNCAGNTATLKQLRDAYNGHGHVVKNVQGGNASVTSEKPGEPVP